jgi:hypothetical protein
MTSSSLWNWNILRTPNLQINLTWRLNHEYHSAISNVTCHFFELWKHRYMVVGCDPWWYWSLLEFQNVSFDFSKKILRIISLWWWHSTNGANDQWQQIQFSQQNELCNDYTYMIWKHYITFVLKAILWLVNTNSNISKVWTNVDEI